MRIIRWVRDHAAELAKFAVVGGVAFVVDIGLFNLLLYGDSAPLQKKVVTAKVISAAVATLVAWVGNRVWTFAGKRVHRPVAELVRFGVVNVAALLIQVGIVALSTYVLDLRTPFWVNAAAVVGIGVGTVARYVGYRAWVFTGGDAPS